ncbi:gene transfer agent family protein [Bradyrhizobium sp. AS23.2]|uniref:gene transfer agent family protein n=1 Tax=Bradyrhizobium sp. AS23.2 TaxID=1680155 RepID=UPI00093EDEFE|nr:gene transfer agent family protein [Bradyrhizobium sp. AS23.2]
MADLSYTAFFGDGEHTFHLTNPMVEELEKKCGPIGALSNRMFARSFSQSDLAEVIRYALIGGNITPTRT